MDQSSGIRAKTRRKRDDAPNRDVPRRPPPISIALALAFALFPPAPAFASGGHDAPPAAAAPEPPPCLSEL